MYSIIVKIVEDIGFKLESRDATPCIVVSEGWKRIILSR